MIRALLLFLCLALPASAQSVSETDTAVIRTLDKSTGALQDITLQRGDVLQLNRLLIRMDYCRYPTNNPSGDAFAHLVITNMAGDQVFFSGWMVASSPALNALDHPRFDVWVLRCNN